MGVEFSNLKSESLFKFSSQTDTHKTIVEYFETDFVFSFKVPTQGSTWSVLKMVFSGMETWSQKQKQQTKTCNWSGKLLTCTF